MRNPQAYSPPLLMDVMRSSSGGENQAYDGDLCRQTTEPSARSPQVNLSPTLTATKGGIGVGVGVGVNVGVGVGVIVGVGVGVNVAVGVGVGV